MRKVAIKFLLPLLVIHVGLYASSLSDTLETTDRPKNETLSEAEVQMPLFNNRILTRVNGEAISLYDVIRKMDFVFYQQFPQFASSTPARLQFYQMHWRSFLDNVVEEKLLLADAKDKKLVVRDGEVREELERMFGPSVIENIDTAGLTFAEAWEMIRNHLTVQRMSYIAVQMKASQKVSPEKVRNHYHTNIDQYMKPSEWEYQVISIKSNDELECSYLANYTFEKIIKDKRIDTQLKNEIEEKASFSSVNISETYLRKENDISNSHLKQLHPLTPGQCSEPAIAVKDRDGGEKEYSQRIFFLKNIFPSKKIPLEELESTISDTLLNSEMSILSDDYIGELKKRFGVDKEELKEKIPNDYQPFSV